VKIVCDSTHEIATSKEINNNHRCCLPNQTETLGIQEEEQEQE
jgi:hypothetical protein